jgi:hypothetical protein
VVLFAARADQVPVRRADGPRHAGCMSVDDRVPRGSLLPALVFCRDGWGASGAWRPLELIMSPTRRAPNSAFLRKVAQALAAVVQVAGLRSQNVVARSTAETAVV